MNPNKLNSMLQKIMAKADRSAATARRQIESGDNEFASARAYYTAFYALQAALLTKDLSFSKHSGVIGAFNLHFVKTGVFPSEFGKIIGRLFQDRHMSDYDFEATMPSSHAQKDVADSERILDAVRNYLKVEGYLSSTAEER